MTPTGQKMTGIAALAVVVACLSLGGTRYDFAPVGKSDRVISIGDCRSNDAGNDEACRRTSLPMFSTEAIEVGPGLTVVGQIAN